MKLTLSEWRRLKNVSQEDLAKLVGVHVNTICGWEREPGKMQIKDVINVAKALDVDLGAVSIF